MFQIDRIPPPTLADRLRRLTWGMCWLLLYRASPVSFHGWRRFLLRLWGATIERGAHPYPDARIWAPWNLIMRRDSCLGPQADCYNVASVELGVGCVVSQKSYLCSASHDFRHVSFPLTGASIVIGEGAWIAAAAFVGPGVVVGAGAIVGAGSVVTRSVDTMSIVAGNPAQRIGVRQITNEAETA